MFIFLLFACASNIQENCSLNMIFYDTDQLEFQTNISIGDTCFESEDERDTVLNKACADAVRSLEEEGFVEVSCDWDCTLLKEGFDATSECLGI